MTVVLDFDVNDPMQRSYRLAHMGKAHLCDWLRANDIDPGTCYRFTVLADGDGQIVVYDYVMPKQLVAGTDEVAVRDPYTVPMLAPVPPELMAEVREGWH